MRMEFGLCDSNQKRISFNSHREGSSIPYSHAASHPLSANRARRFTPHPPCQALGRAASDEVLNRAHARRFFRKTKENDRHHHRPSGPRKLSPPFAMQKGMGVMLIDVEDLKA